MIRFSSNQFRQFEVARRKGFYDALRRDLRAFMAKTDPSLSEDRVDTRITQAFQTCADNGFRTEKQITRLCYILVTFPRDYPVRAKYVWIDKMIKANASADVRLDRITASIKAGASST